MSESHLLSAFILLMAVACNEDTTDSTVTPLASPASLVTVRDLTRLDGCSLVLEQENGENLEPYFPPAEESSQYYNDAQWDSIDPQDGLRLQVTYDTLTDQLSICMVGPVVGITSLKVINPSSK